MGTTLFTGAGASRAFGYPLTSELLPQVRASLDDESLFTKLGLGRRAKEDRKRLLKYLKSLMPEFRSLPNRDLPAITDLFSLVEYSLVMGEALPVGDAADLRQFRDLLKLAITDVLLGEFTTPWSGRDPEDLRQRRILGALVQWVKEQGVNFGLVTTNYDIGIEFELFERQKGSIANVDLGFDWRHVGDGREQTRPRKPSLRVYKLHGSLNTLLCRACGFVYFNYDGSIAHQAFRSKLDDNNTCVCRDDLKLDLHIVAPSLVREVHDANLRSVWRSALEWLRRSNRWVIVGYSLPPEDLAVRSLLLRAYHGRPRKPKVVVVQRGCDAKARYRALFPKCDYRTGGLEDFLGID